MPTDVHAHYVPPSILEALETRGAEFGVSLVKAPPSCALQFDHGLKARPFFEKLVEPVERRFAGLAQQGVDRQVLSLWADIFAYGLADDRRRRWHRFLNEHLGAFCARHSRRFAMLATVPLPNAAAAAAELEHAVNELGAVGAVVAANVEGVNLGELDLDEFWHAAVELDVAVFIHPTQPTALPRTTRFALAQIAQYPHDTTLCVGSLIFAGVLDRFPRLRLLLSHGGGTFPYLTGRFDCMHDRMDRASQSNVAAHEPSAYLNRFHYDSILHDPAILRWLATRVSVDRIVLGSDYSFPPADRDPLGTLRRAEFSRADFEKIVDANPRVLFPRLASD
jgi:aminocarboxymuconate-semialdehyde decarboxylase